MIATEPEKAAPQAAGIRWGAFAVVLSGAFMDSVDATMLTVMVPTVRADLGASDAMTQWTVAGYLLAFAVLLVTGGRCGDVFGKRRTFSAGAIVFGLASAWCGLATSGEALVLGRVVQGIGAAVMVPQAAALVTTLFPKKDWPAAFGVFGAVLSLGSVCGPLIGGLVTAADLAGLGWRAAFLVNVPLCVLAVLGSRWIPDDRSPAADRLDGRGLVLSAAAAGALLVPLVNGRELGWPWWSAVVFVAAAPLGWAFWRHQVSMAESGRAPLVPPRLFIRPSFGHGLVLVLVVYLAVTSCFLIVTLALQGGLGWGIVRTALTTAAWPLGIAATFQLGWRLSAGRERALVAAGCLTMSAGVLGLAAALWPGWLPDSTWAVAGALALLGGGMGLTSPVLTATVLGQVPPEDNGAGSGVLNAVVQFGGAAGVALLGTVFFALADRGQSFERAGAVTLLLNAALLGAAALLSSRLHDPGHHVTDGGQP